MALGCEVRQGRFDDVMLLVGDQLPVGSIYRLLAEHGGALFGDEYFADLFKASTRGRPTVPARVVATVMLLQAYEGLSDREACDRLAFDLRWKAAAGLTVGAAAFHPTVLVGMRNRLRASDRPRRLFDDVNTIARAAGLLRGRRRVLDSTPLFDAVATQDTVIQLRAVIRKVLSAADRADPVLAGTVRTALQRDDDYATLGKPPCDWDDPAAREALVDALVRDALAVLAVLDGHELGGPLAEAAELLGLVAGQDVEAGEDGVFRIARRVARDRLISTVDVAARHGHKSRARTFDGYKSHLSVDPDEELITNVAVTAANTADREVIDELLAEPATGAPADTESVTGEPYADTAEDDGCGSQNGSGSKGFEVYGDSAYAGGATLDEQTRRGHDMRAKVPPVR
ncbi:transposase, partial [Mycobacterium kyorinense]